MFGRKRRSLSDFDEEIQAHIELEIEEFMKDGLGEKEARYAAMRKFGNVTIAHERFYEFGRWLWLDTFVRNLCLACRIIRRQPVSTLSIILLLALGIGGVTAVFNPIYSTIFVPLPFPQPEQLVRIGGDIPLFNNRYSRFEKEESLERIFSNVTAYIPAVTRARIRVTGTDISRDVYPTEVAENFFETFGVQLLRGSGFSRKEDRDSVVISYRFWRDVMGRADDAVGRYILAGPMANPRRIVGIMPEGFNFPNDTDVWTCISGTDWPVGNATQFAGRLRPGISIELAAEELKSIDFPVSGVIGNSGPVLQSLQIFLSGDQRPLLRLLGAAAILFLALACAGVMNLLIAQGARRKQEIATRLIMGAPRRSLVFQLLTEVLPLVIVGGLAGWWLSEIASAWLWTQLPALRGGTVTVPVKMAFWAALLLAVTLIGGLIPSLYATGLDLNIYLKAASDGKRRFLSSREFLVGVQLGLALALLIGMSVLIRSMMFRVDFPIGWSPREIAVVSAYPVDSVDDTEIHSPMYFQDVYSELNALPEVMSFGYLHPIPFSALAGYVSSMPERVSKILPIKGQGWPPGTPVVTAIWADADSAGFDVLGIPFIAGRPFTEKDGARRLEIGLTGRVGGAVIINQALAELLWPGENAVGKELFMAYGFSFEVVGIVRNFHHTPGDNNLAPAMYLPMTGAYIPTWQLLVRLRPGASLKNFQANVQRSLSGLAAVPMEFEAQPLSEHVKEALASRRLTLQLLGCFAVLGIVVSGLGIYATATLMAAERTRETGIRMAMGATTLDILRLALWRGIRAILIGLPFGLFLAWILSKVLSSFLVQVNTGDPLAWGISCAVFIVIVTVAALIPALRATRINPLDAMRE